MEVRAVYACPSFDPPKVSDLVEELEDSVKNSNEKTIKILNIVAKEISLLEGPITEWKSREECANRLREIFKIVNRKGLYD